MGRSIGLLPGISSDAPDGSSNQQVLCSPQTLMAFESFFLHPEGTGDASNDKCVSKPYAESPFDAKPGEVARSGTAID
jgi:hypothetical protein